MGSTVPKCKLFGGEEEVAGREISRGPKEEPLGYEQLYVDCEVSKAC